MLAGSEGMMLATAPSMIPTMSSKSAVDNAAEDMAGCGRVIPSEIHVEPEKKYPKTWFS